jgi:hypothetical protein
VTEVQELGDDAFPRRGVEESVELHLHLLEMLSEWIVSVCSEFGTPMDDLFVKNTRCGMESKGLRLGHSQETGFQHIYFG